MWKGMTLGICMIMFQSHQLSVYHVATVVSVNEHGGLLRIPIESGGYELVY